MHGATSTVFGRPSCKPFVYSKAARTHKTYRIRMAPAIRMRFFLTSAAARNQPLRTCQLFMVARNRVFCYDTSKKEGSS